MKRQWRSILLAGVSSVAIASGARAADMGPPAKAPYAPPPPVSSWQGFYFGINGGAGRLNTSQAHLTPGADGVCGDGTVTCDGSATGALFGGQVGYNWQSRYWVYGIEADWDWTNLKHDATNFSNVATGSTVRAAVDSLGSVRGRMGLALDDTMLYLTGGVAFGETRSGWGGGYSGTTGCCVSQTGFRTGWVAGVGAEHMFTQNISFRTEFLYYDLGTQTVNTNFGGTTYTTQFSQEVLVGRVGLNYKW
jgi:outer membrane immunogenic protein